MPNPDKILMRKIKKREKKKIKLINQKNNEVSEDNAEAEANTETEVKKTPRKDKKKAVQKNAEANTETKVKKIPHEDNEKAVPKKAEANTETKVKKIPHEDKENAVPKKKKKKVRQEVEPEPVPVTEESESENSGSKAEQDCNSENESEETTNTNTESELPGSSLLSDQKFTVLEGKVCESTMMSIKEMGLTTMTEIQSKTIPPLLEGKHLVGVAKTGSGKTLAFLIPAIDIVYKLQFKPRNGTGAIILCPTREVAMQTYGVLMELMKYNRHTYGLVMGGAKKSTEARKLANGVNILVATPGRLLDHMQNTPYFVYKNLICLVIDEADRILEIGFEEEVKQIIRLIPKRRQTILFSATRSQKTETLATNLGDGIILEPTYVGVDDHTDKATVDSLVQGYLECPSEDRMKILFTLLKRSNNKKVMVFFSTCMSVQYHHKLFNYIDLPVMSIHGKQEQAKRTTTFFQFCNAESGILLCTDVAARGLDIPAVDWIVQYDPPDDAKEYIHRVGRTARGLGTSGQAVMFLRPEELAFLRVLKQYRVTLNEYGFSEDKVFDLQPPLEQLISRNHSLNQSAKEALQSYLRAYDSHRLKTIFNIDTIDMAKVSKSFGFAVPPAIELKGARRGPPQKRKGGRW